MKNIEIEDMLAFKRRITIVGGYFLLLFIAYPTLGYWNLLPPLSGLFVCWIFCVIFFSRQLLLAKNLYASILASIVLIFGNAYPHTYGIFFIYFPVLSEFNIVFDEKQKRNTRFFFALFIIGVLINVIHFLLNKGQLNLNEHKPIFVFHMLFSMVALFLSYVVYLDSHKQKIKKLLLIESNQKTLLENSPELIYHIDKKYRIIQTNSYFSKTLYKLFGKMPKAGDDAFSFFHADQREKVKKAIDRAIQGEIIQLEHTFSIEGKQKVWVDIRYVPVNANGSAEDSVLIIIRDISIFKRSVERIEKLAGYISRTPFPILEIGKNGRLLYHNKAANSLTPHLLNSGYIKREYLDKFRQLSGNKNTEDFVFDGKTYVFQVIESEEGNMEIHVK